MSLLGLIDFLNMDREADASYRAYDLLHGAGPRRVRHALRELKYRGEESLALAELAANLYARGQASDDLRRDLCEWYIWHRIDSGILRHWPLRSSS